MFSRVDWHGGLRHLSRRRLRGARQLRSAGSLVKYIKAQKLGQSDKESRIHCARDVTPKRTQAGRSRRLAPRTSSRASRV